MKERIFSGAALLLFLAAAVIFNDWFAFALNIAVAVVSMLAVYELIKALRMEKEWFVSAPSMITAAAVCCLADPLAIFAVYCVYTAILFAGLIARHMQVSFKDIAVVLSMTILIPLAMHSLISLRGLSEDHGMFYVLVGILSAWGADAGAYFAGTFFGRHQLAPQISPKKTVEGAVGGGFVNVLIMLLCGVLFTHVGYAGEITANYWALALIGVLGAFTSILGDLSFSLIKRGCHIKDFGQVIPGHGGILDRFDSVIFTAPFVYLLVALIPIVSR